MATLFSRIRQWLDDVRRYDTFVYRKFAFRLPKDKCENLRRSVELATSFRDAYLAKCEKGRTCASGFHRDVQNAILMVFREFDRVCKAHGFAYAFYGGALLGACRHGGFVPWDDDIDVIMPREQYEKIIDVFNAESSNPSLRAKWVSPSRGAVFIKIEAVGEPMVFIDILPCDCYSNAPAGDLLQYQKNRRKQIFSRVLPDKTPAATYGYFAALRSGSGLIPVAHDSPSRRLAVCAADWSEARFFDADIVFPFRRTDFEGMSVPIPANSEAMLHKMYGKRYEVVPITVRSHCRYRKLTIDRMLNVKRFLRSDSLRLPRTSISGRADATESRWDRFVTFARKAASPVFNVITRDTLKEYRLFSKTSVFRLRSDRVIRGHLEAVESYSRLLQDKNVYPRAKGAARQQQLASVDVLARVLRACEREGLTAWLWSGSLLGALRDGAFLNMDRHTFVLMPRADYERFRSACDSFTDAGAGALRARLRIWGGGIATSVAGDVPGAKVIVIPCDYCPDDWNRRLYAKYIANARNKAELAELTAKKDMEGLYKHFAAARERMGIGLESDKSRSIFPAWDCPGLFEQSHVLAAKYYAPSAKHMFEGIEAPVPADADMVLTSLYGDWLYHV